MESQQVLEDREYLDLYNKGYGMYQFSPEMADLINSTKSTDPRIAPLKAGISKAMHEKEINMDYTPDWLKKDRFKENTKDIGDDLDKDNDLDKDIDFDNDHEPEIDD